MIIGLTGMYCAGKNYIAKLLQNRGIPVLDIDVLGHSVIKDKKPEIIACFGEQVLNLDGSVNRHKLGSAVFGREEELSALEGIVHPEINSLSEQWLASQSGKICVINAAVLHKFSVFNQIDRIILVNAPFFVRLLRAKRRDKLSFAVLIRRFSSQKHFTAQYLAGNADIYKVENSCCRTHANLERQIDVILSN